VRVKPSHNEDIVPWLTEQIDRPPRRLRARRGVPMDDLRCHPDLCDRVSALADGLPNVRLRYVAGLPLLVHPNGVVFAVGAGTTWIAVRIPRSAHGAVVRSQWGQRGLEGEWIDVDPWMTDVSAHDGLRRLRGWARAAYDHGTELAGLGPRARPGPPARPTRPA
jgi:hypothetical protein